MVTLAALMAAPSLSSAAPVAGYEAVYSAVFTGCTLPAGGFTAEGQDDAALVTCEAAIVAYSGALVTNGTPIEDANVSFTELRKDVFAANEPDKEFQARIDALFELLLPNSGALAPVPSVTQ